ncbi:MAG: cryptochrome/photolyase family protein [Cytophagales bacterium]|nr:cryptochrome/photolyase family protein [Bernardetiaceae bacterium]MDW8209459.1 cryptochrome/photolyase family protein [Cytophagales bacterium]
MTLRLILGDQLNIHHSWFAQVRSDVVYVMMEVRQETDYVAHHIQKIIAFFAAMRSFAEELRQQGHQVIYLKINDPQNRQNFADNLTEWMRQIGAERFEYQQPDEYRLDKYFADFCRQLPISSQMVDSQHFLTHRMELAEIFKGKKTYLLEAFYRTMRKKYRILLDENGQPEGGKWNYDAQNRKHYDGKAIVPDLPMPSKASLEIVRQVYQDILQASPQTIGKVQIQNFEWLITRQENLEALHDFCRYRLPHFGRYQDAMDSRYPYLFHSRLSFAMNVKLIHPMEVVQTAIEYWRQNQQQIDLAQIEGFVRQIIGWREYMRGVYWAQMPRYATLNFFNHSSSLPSWYWNGNTRMNCLQCVITQSLEKAYAHHIQRLMITGNFALLAGVAPNEVDNWYLGIYADAIEWVEITNTRGMSQFADGGLVGTKPYVSSANYINKMSNYCQHCYYDKNLHYGQRACPFNSLYWHFYYRHRQKLEHHPRVSIAYTIWDKMPRHQQQKILQQAEEYLSAIESL